MDGGTGNRMRVFCVVLLPIFGIVVGSFLSAVADVGLRDCEIGNGEEQVIAALCGDFTFPEDHADLTGPKITLPVIRIPATHPSGKRPLFLLQGGPGASNIWKNPYPWMYRDQDFVMVGYRGADGSPILYCPGLTKAQLGLDGDLLGSTSLDQFAEAVGECANDIEASGTRLKYFSMIEVVEDVERLRRALNLGPVDLLSESYGTRLAQIYSWKYPDSIGRSVMIGVNPPGHFVWEPDLIDEQIRYVSELCKRDEYCRSRTSDFAGSFRRVFKDPPRSWLGLSIDAGMVRFLGFNFLHHASSAPMFYDAVLAADEGDASGLAMMTLLFHVQIRIGPPQPWGDLFAKGMADYDPARDYATEMKPADSTFGSPASELLMAVGPTWPSSGFPDEFRTVQRSDVETLLINGSVDFSTPVQNGRKELLPSLTNGHLVELKEFGYVGDVYKMQPDAAERLILGFLHDGVVDDSKFEYQPLNFEPRFGFPFMMKAALAAVALVLLLLVLTVRWIVRRLVR